MKSKRKLNLSPPPRPKSETEQEYEAINWGFAVYKQSNTLFFLSELTLDLSALFFLYLPQPAVQLQNFIQSGFGPWLSNWALKCWKKPAQNLSENILDNTVSKESNRIVR